MAKSAITTYGEALFQIATESSSSIEMLEEVKELKNVVDANPELKELMSNPRFSKEEHLEILEKVFKGKIDERLFSFLELLTVKGRYGYLDEILDYFILRVKEYLHIGQAKVTSAIAIDDEMKQRIKDKLLSTTDYKEIEIEYETDPSLIGGMVIRIKDRIVDNSVKTKLENITRDLHKIQI
ncbi:MAG: F0F1 ATP synthase subunit delta [Lachnospiraceae bacterium]|nr:F0F1 ATP synthase subunit delta [Lachnospiraceae bacterium]MBR4413092.1 F0F1 ATP synthase subunit delta [Lachnospiraceae bacterium]MBR5067333.1 F0F1 ATP synthase subunit delta [Lachnospiraceae bacterium]MBR5916591.1 F0F1 ATP synthase subunit delta [Lachnospiraceae bacterium]